MKRFVPIILFWMLVLAKPSSSEEVKSADRQSAPSAQAYHHTFLGLQYEEEGDDAQALKEYQQALSHDPDAPFLLGQIGRTLLKLGELEEAAEYLEKADKDDETVNLLANLYASLGKKENAVAVYEHLIAEAPKDIAGYISLARFRIAQNDISGAISVLSRGIAADPTSYLGPYYLAKLFVHEKAYDKGIEQYQKALELYPAFEPASIELAGIHETLGQHDAAAAVYRKVLDQKNMEHKEAGIRLAHILMQKEELEEASRLLLRLDEEMPNDPDIWLKISLLRAEQKEYAKAEGALKKVLSQWPHALELKVYLASLYEMQQEYENALAAYQEALDTGGDPYDIHIRRGSLYLYRLKKAEDALAEGEKARKINSEKPEAYLLIGQALYESKRFGEATAVFEKGIALTPDRPDFHFHLGATYDKLNRFEDLVAAMGKAIALDPSYAVALNYLGYTYADKGIHLDEAVELIHRALSVHPDDGYYVDSLAWAYYKQGKVKEALSLLKKAASMVPDDPVILEHLGELYLKENQRDEARAAWVRALDLDAQNEKLKIRFQNAGFSAPAPAEAQPSHNAH